ncbi:threonyl-tRNA synthetase, putative [Eimeria maxima]|uniref:Threonyl-tRNA synthetase n=1 Tax=Eimeria maxima TaxID=5804 RepID=U6MA80_EIMMA|nr:threonyl-tRNA synthetase, putative [Eimeria maxima]CDJ60956.1 threonyl-tRNA synthetase, putative [Eimeria maxima]
MVAVHLMMLFLRPKSSQGSEDEWASAEELLRSALEQHRISFMVASGEGAFYGPKIDIHLPDGEGRLWQTGTLQVDLVSPRNFGLEPTATNSDRVCFLHRAMCGSLERFFGLVLEHLDGHLPLWLAPTQVALLTVGEGQAISAEAISRRLRRAKIRVSLDTRPVHISKKLKYVQPKTTELHINYRTPEVWILGRTDQERNTVTVRRPHGKQAAAPVERALASVRRRAKIPF